MAAENLNMTRIARLTARLSEERHQRHASHSDDSDGMIRVSTSGWWPGDPSRNKRLDYDLCTVYVRAMMYVRVMHGVCTG